MNPIEERVLKKITPTEEERRKEEAFAQKIIQKIKKIEPETKAVLAGSLSRNTHLKNTNDIDLFVLFNKNIPRKEFEVRGLSVGKKIFKGHKWEKAYSEHPYIRGTINGFNVEIVPSYAVEKAEFLQSSVDRSPFHTEYLKKNLKEEQKKDVRLLRQFLKGINAYGAELKTNSMPGYVVELLILKYGSFEKTLKKISQWKKNEIITFGKADEIEIRKRFESPLVVIDPVDSKRNVASALSLNQMARLVAAAREYLKKPSEKFFFVHKRRKLKLNKVRELLKKTELIALEMSYPKELSDIVWGQLKKFRKKIAKTAEEKDFHIIRATEWTDEEKRMIVLLELETLALQKTKKLVGPEVFEEVHGEKFLNAHTKRISGPRIENGRWVIEVERKITTAKQYIKEFIKKTRKEGNKSVERGIKKKTKILNEEELIELYKKDKGFCEFFSDYLRGKEIFL
jgi:tRNA nucleotidyltransferase (CCA-adding enzyme)